MPAHGQRQQPRRCEAPGCRRDAVAKGLCLMHYKRRRAGRPLVEPGPAKGDPDGHGVYGSLSDDGETVQCHECGHRAPSIGVHVYAVHEMTAREYKLAHGLPLSRGLTSDAARAARSEHARSSDAGLAALDRYRDPAAASAARDSEAFAWAAMQRGPEQGVRVGRAGRSGRVEACIVCGVQWCPLPGGYRVRTCSYECWLQAIHPVREELVRRTARMRADSRRGMTAREIGERYGLHPTWVRQILRTGTTRRT